MNRNVGSWDRWLRVVGAVALAVCAVVAPYSLALRLLAFGAPALYMLGTALFGSCLGYALMGKSTCPARQP